MCAACGVETHVAVGDPEPVADVVDPRAEAAAGPVTGTRPTGRRFAALANRDCRPYLIGAMLSMMADNIEHVITYWILWEKFHSPALTGFEVLSHWLPFLTLSVYFGGLADRFDCRRVIQAAQVLFMAVSVAWGILFLTDSLTVWNACLLLVLHGIAGSMWAPAEQLMLHDFVGDTDLPSAVRLNATFRSLGILFGPVVGSALLLGLGATTGIFVNVAIYLPLTVFLMRTRFTGHSRAAAGTARPRMTMASAIRVLREVAANHTLISMILLAGLGSLFIGVALQTAMPIFANLLGAGSAGLAYGILLFANGFGGVVGGFLLEASGRVPQTVRSAVVSTAVFGLAIVGFAVVHNYVVACLLLVVGGVANMASMSITQTVVQLMAPPDRRGQVVGVYGMSASGLRIGPAFTVGFLGDFIGLPLALAISAGLLVVGAIAAGVYSERRPAAV